MHRTGWPETNTFQMRDLRDFIKHLGRLVVHYGVRPDHKAVEAVLTWREL